MNGNLVVENTTVPARLQVRWNVVYAAYLGALEAKGADALARRDVAAWRSVEVAGVYREMARTPNLAEWLLVAVTTSAEAFEMQAADWAAASDSDVPWNVREARR